jgi:hypothetical protein
LAAVVVLDGAAMRAFVLTALATSGVLLSGMAVRQADAAMPFGPSAATATPVQTIASVCGSNGCVRVQTQRVVKQQKAGNVILHRN